MGEQENIFKDLGVEVELTADFHKIVKTLERMGIATASNELVQTCHLFHKRGRYTLMHFKELFAFDGKETYIEADDITRRNTIIFFLSEWGMVDVIEPTQIENRFGSTKDGNFRVIPINEFKSAWKHVVKYSMGNS